MNGGAVDGALKGRVAVVTGASRGAGLGIALELGAAGATVYVTGRSTRAEPAGGYGQILAMSGLARMPGDIESTADAVTHAGGRGIAVLCDHTQADQVQALFARVQATEAGSTCWSTTPGAATKLSTVCSTRRSGPSRWRTGIR